MKTGIVDLSDLPALARHAHEESGLTKAEAARRIDATPQAYGQALKDGGSLHDLRRRIIEEFTDYRVVGPEYRLVKKRTAA